MLTPLASRQSEWAPLAQSDASRTRAVGQACVGASIPHRTRSVGEILS